MNLHILASGSTGNAIFLEIGGAKILVDAGISARRIEKGLRAVGIEPAALDAILVTHEHSDHIHGVGVLARRYGLAVYANQGTWQAMASKLGSTRWRSTSGATARMSSGVT